MPCNCDDVKEELTMIRHSVGEMYSFLIEVRDTILTENYSIIQLLYPMAMEHASQELQEIINRKERVGDGIVCKEKEK